MKTHLTFPNPLLFATKNCTSDEFEWDPMDSLVKIHQRAPSSSVLDDSKEEHVSTRKHHSLGMGGPREISHGIRSVERRVYLLLVGAELGIVTLTLDTPWQVLLPQVTVNSFIHVVFIRLISRCTVWTHMPSALWLFIP
jgi:hypothetical protein